MPKIVNESDREEKEKFHDWQYWHAQTQSQNSTNVRQKCNSSKTLVTSKRDEFVTVKVDRNRWHFYGSVSCIWFTKFFAVIPHSVFNRVAVWQAATIQKSWTCSILKRVWNFFRTSLFEELAILASFVTLFHCNKRLYDRLLSWLKLTQAVERTAATNFHIEFWPTIHDAISLRVKLKIR